ncbi:MAG TPA: Uma2 family endonuclease [Isosphaeraceae bacterium]|jgi:Uma2 family endonuclease
MAIAEPTPAVGTGADRRFVLYDVSWRFYEAFLAEMAERRIFLTYDRGTLEIMSPSEKLGRSSCLIGRMVELLTEELEIPVDGLGMTTFRREDRERGLEPDECYYIRNEPLVRGKDEIDLTVDPPPDLAIEVDVSRNSLKKLDVYAALGFPEVWRFDGTTIHVHVLQGDGRYAVGGTSASFPFLPMAQLGRFLQMAPTMDKTSWARAFREWVRAEVAPRYQEAVDEGPHP